MNHTSLSAFIWSVADLLRGDYKQSAYGKVILPFTVLRRLDCVLAATKAAVISLTKTLSFELGGNAIRVNAIAPGLVATDGFLGRVRTNGPSTEEVIARMTAMQTIKRPAGPADLGNALAFLVSDDADFVTGQILHVDGGVTRTGA